MLTFPCCTTQDKVTLTMNQIQWEILPSDHFPARKGRFAAIWMVPGGGLVLAVLAGDLKKKLYLKFVYFLLAQKDAFDFSAADLRRLDEDCGAQWPQSELSERKSGGK